MGKRLTIIVGAGGSRDLIGNRTAIVRDEYTPPLARDLFTAAPPGVVDYASHGAMAQGILERYPRALAAAATLGLRGNQTLEAAMKEMQASTEMHLRRQFVQVPVYLRQLFWEICHAPYTTLPVNYTHLLNRVMGSDFERVGLITTNYDTFLEDAISSVLDARFTGLDSYISDAKWALVKIHGSINWALGIPGEPPPQDHQSYLRHLDDLTQWDKDGVFGRLQALRLWNIEELWDETRAVYPALVVPVEGKYNFLCPDKHVEVARELIKTSTNFLIIGSSGLDEDLIDILRENVDIAFTLGIVSRGDVREVLSRFQQITKFYGSPVLLRLGNEGFSRFIAKGHLSEFLKVLYDDDNRDAWTNAMSRAALPPGFGGTR